MLGFQQIIVFLACLFLRSCTCYRLNTHHKPSVDLSQEKNANAYINLNNFGSARRLSRQVQQLGFGNNNPSAGFDWGSVSQPQRRRQNNNFNRPSRQDNDAVIFFDDDDDSNNGNTDNRNSFNNNNGFNDRANNNFNGDLNDGFFNVPNSIVSTTQRPQTSTLAFPGMGTTRSPCEDRCQTTPEYNPVCGDDNMTYFSTNRLRCAQRCGKQVNIRHPGACARMG